MTEKPEDETDKKEMSLTELLTICLSNWMKGHPHQEYILTINDTRDKRKDK